MEELDLKKIEKVEDAPVVVHGTYQRFWPSIGESPYHLPQSTTKAERRCSQDRSQGHDPQPYSLCDWPFRRARRQKRSVLLTFQACAAPADRQSKGMRANCDIFIYLDVEKLLRGQSVVVDWTDSC